MRRRSLLAIAFGLFGLGTLWNLAENGLGAERVVLRSLTEEGEQFAKIELLIQVDRKYQNPFDPEEVAVDLQIRSPSGKDVKLPAFWYQPYERRVLERSRPSDWVYPAGGPEWRARFTPTEPGPYELVAQCTDAEGQAESSPIRWVCRPSPRRGFLRTSRQDPRFLEHTTGEPFFGIGQNLAFIGFEQPIRYAKAEEVFRRLRAEGANFLRIWTCCEDWALAVEAWKNAWGRSWASPGPIVPMPGQAAEKTTRRCVQIGGEHPTTVEARPPNPLAVRPETAYVLTGKVLTEKDVHLRIQTGSITLGEPIRSESPQQWSRFRWEFRTAPGQYFLGGITFRLEGKGRAWLDGLSLTEAAGGPELLSEADPNRPVRGYYNPVDCFMLDQLLQWAEREGLYLQLCLITRDLYMPALAKDPSPEYDQAIRDAKKLLRYAVARWSYSTSLAAWEYFNEMNPGLPTDRFYDELGKYLEQIEPYGHPRTTSAWGFSPKDWRHPRLDWAQGHHYLRPADKEKAHDEVAVVLERTALLRQHAPNRPIMLAEFGLAEDNWQRSRWMTEDKQLVHFHNALWASALSGSGSTTMFWWWEVLDQMDAYQHYRPLAQFLADIPWTTDSLVPVQAEVEGAPLHVMGLVGRSGAYVWLRNPQSTWYATVVEKKPPAPIQQAVLHLRALPPGKYRIQWWDPWTGKVLAEIQTAVPEGVAQLTVPSNIPLQRDIACKLRRL